ncbi:MAG: hypothetical protein ISP49_12190 [Reyranella sp.]|jgi:hypothetical protein|nr:hypothetical protein [Reyranella sp.]
MTIGRPWKIAAVVVLPVVGLAVAAAFTYLRFPANPDSLDITGYTGRLGEWEVTAAVVRTGNELVGPMTMKHVGICTQEGPQEKTGELRLRLSSFTPQVVAALVVDGVECAYRGPLSEAHLGELLCPERRPVPITLWTR